MNAESKEECAERAYQMAREIIDQEWIAAGVTREELDQADQVANLLDRLVASGHNFNNLMKDWEHKSAETILLEYAPLVPPLHTVSH